MLLLFVEVSLYRIRTYYIIYEHFNEFTRAVNIFRDNAHNPLTFSKRNNTKTKTLWLNSVFAL